MTRKHKTATVYTHTHTQLIFSACCGASERGACNG